MRWLRDIWNKIRFRVESGAFARVRQMARTMDWLAGLLFAGFLFVVYLAFDAYSGLKGLDGIEAERTLEWLKFYAYLAGGIVLIWQVRISNRRATALEKTAALGEKGNITERFKNAIEHLSHEKNSLQIGGIYTLYHVAKEATEYREAVLKILLSRLREITKERTSASPEVVAAILDVLFAPKNKKPLFKSVDMSGVNLQGFLTPPSWAHQRNLGTIERAVDLNLSDTKWTSSKFAGAFMRRSICNNTSFWRANLTICNFSFAICNQADFSEAVCVGTSFFGIRNFEGVRFYGTNLSYADFCESSITAQQLLRARTLYKALLPARVRGEIMREKPQLLAPPTE